MHVPAHRHGVHATSATLLPALVLVLSMAASGVAAQEAPKNLQVLPKDMQRAQLTQVMRSFTAALGVRCSTCHVGEEGQPLSTYDFASDDKPMKLKARAMLQMSMAINNSYLAELPGRREPNVRVTCVTCHRGVSRPQPIETIVAQVMQDDGVEAALQSYRDLRERHFGGFAYDFTDRPLVSLAESLMEENPEAARGVLELNLEFNPGSGMSLYGLAQIYDAAGDTSKAVEYYRKGLEVMPGNPRAERRLKELTGGA
jgi:tetratricopeptide (TPR) repeat protein